jgi:hypothetical protein
MPRSPELHQRLVELLGEMFDALEPERPREQTIGEQAARRRRRDAFVKAGIEALRLVAKAARR